MIEPVPRATLRRVVRARDLLHDETQRGPTLDELARVSGLSPAHLARAFARTFGEPPHRYLTGLRIARAKHSLASGASVTEACLAAGFESLGSFSAGFHKRVGVSPRVWQQGVRTQVQSRGVPTLYIPGCFLYRLGCS